MVFKATRRNNSSDDISTSGTYYIDIDLGVSSLESIRLISTHNDWRGKSTSSSVQLIDIDFDDSSPNSWSGRTDEICAILSSTSTYYTRMYVYLISIVLVSGTTWRFTYEVDGAGETKSPIVYYSYHETGTRMIETDYTESGNDPTLISR